MNIEDSVYYVAEKFEYRTDPKIFDYWSVMRVVNGKMCGDCDDFSLTAIWKICDSNILKFVFNVFILHKYRLYFSKTSKGERHLVGYADGLYFDNWTKKAMPLNEFLECTKHKIYFFFPCPFMILPSLLGLIARYR